MQGSTERAERRLPEGYYLDNFELLLETVAERDADLLLSAEIDFLTDFGRLSLGARRLYVRLLSRKGPTFRRDRMSYEEVPSIDAAVDELAAASFVDRAEDASAPELLELMLRPELAELATELTPEEAISGARKRRLLALLIEGADTERLLQRARRQLQPIRLRRFEPIEVFRLLFFGNLSQDWTEFMLRDLGVMRYESYELRRELRLFPHRRAVDEYLAWRSAKIELRRRLEAGDHEAAMELAEALLEQVEGNEPVDHRLADRLCNEVGQYLERRGEPRRALAFYAAAHTPPARERRVRILARLGGVARALALCEEIGAGPRDETEVVFARKYAHRLRRMRGEPLPAPVQKRRPTRRLTLARDDSVTVERQALAALAATGRQGFFAENWLWQSLFGLAFWDVVFAPVAGAFQHAFQLGPLDLSSPSFRLKRADAIEQRLEELRDEPEPAARLLARYDEKQGISNRLVSWHDGAREQLELALSRLTGRQLAWVFDRLSRDLMRYRRGFPDLFVLLEAAPGFELLEVKSPADQLRPEQKAWIDYLNDGGLPAKILNVRWRP